MKILVRIISLLFLFGGGGVIVFSSCAGSEGDCRIKCVYLDTTFMYTEKTFFYGETCETDCDYQRDQAYLGLKYEGNSNIACHKDFSKTGDSFDCDPYRE